LVLSSQSWFGATAEFFGLALGDARIDGALAAAKVFEKVGASQP
jgi:hypothetical protein